MSTGERVGFALNPRILSNFHSSYEERLRPVSLGRSWKFARATDGFAVVLALVCAAMLCTGCQTRSTAASETAKAGPVASISFCAASAQTCVPAASFSVASTRELAIRAWTTGVPLGNHTETLSVLMPGGEEFPESRTGFRVPDGSKDALPEMRTIPIADLRTAHKRVIGNWTVRLSLDGKLLETETFEMRP
jgi:hypothetical protein